MRIALLSDCYLPRLGGIEVQVHDLAAQLSARGHEVEVFTATPGAAGQRHGAVDVVDGVAVHRLAIRLPWDLPVNPLAPKDLRLRLPGFDVAHVHIGVVSPFAVDAARTCVRLGLATTMTWHCMLHHTEALVSRLGVVRRWAARGVAMNAVSHVAALPLRRVVGAAGEVTVLPNGIDTAAWRPEGTPRRARGGEPVRIVTAMRLAARKRPLPLLRVAMRMRELVPAGLDVRLDVLGDGPDRSRVERFLVAHGMTDWVGLPGRVPRDEVRSRYAAADVYISPGELESFGIAALEARTAGLPVVARSGSGIGEFVTDGLNGFLARTDEGLASALARLVTDHALRQRMTAHNLRHPPAQDWASVAATAEGEYARAVGAAPGR